MPLNPLVRVASKAHVIENANIDTDVVYPARFLLVLDRDGIGQYAFRDWRQHRDGSHNSDFPAPELMRGERQILLGGPNFGCGSSREHAVWTLVDLNIRCVIAPSFGEIFYNNCFKNGVLPVRLPLGQWQRLAQEALAGDEIEVDLTDCTVRSSGGDVLSFEVPEQAREALLNGWDEIDMMLSRDGDTIRQFEDRRREDLPWLFRPLS